MGLTVGSSRLTMFITIVAVVLVANAVNFVDGLDGLAAGIAGIAALAFFIYSYALARNASPDDYASFACVVVAALVGICAGFLPHNFHRARIFMGDSGALMLGVLIAAAGILVTGQIDPLNNSTGYALPAIMPILVPVAVILLPLIDLVWAVVRRLARGQSPFQADAGHLHHRLLRLGHSHAGAVLVLYMWAAIASFTCVALVRFPAVRVAPIAVVGVIVGVAVTARQFRGRREVASHPQEEPVRPAGPPAGGPGGHEAAPGPEAVPSLETDGILPAGKPSHEREPVPATPSAEAGAGAALAPRAGGEPAHQVAGEATSWAAGGPAVRESALPTPAESLRASTHSQHGPVRPQPEPEQPQPWPAQSQSRPAADTSRPAPAPAHLWPAPAQEQQGSAQPQQELERPLSARSRTAAAPAQQALTQPQPPAAHPQPEQPQQPSSHSQPEHDSPPANAPARGERSRRRPWRR